MFQKLHDMRVEIFNGDLDNITTLNAALQGCDSVFGVTYSRFSKENEEFRHGQLLAECAKSAGVSHFVFRLEKRVSFLIGFRKKAKRICFFCFF